ncbi:MAG: tetratricopeptide repeat protein [Bacteroidia bacterium]
MTAKVNGLADMSSLVKRYTISIFFLVFVIYGNSIWNGYGPDDNYVTVTDAKGSGNLKVAKGIAGIKEIFTTHYIQTKEASFEYRPIPLMTFAIEHEFFGNSPHISHFINVLLYAITCSLLFLVLLKLFGSYSIVFPFLITLLFLLHPIHTEVVCSIRCRDELLAFLFGLCSLYFFLTRTDTDKWKPVVVAGIFLLIALLCKKTAILFCALLPLTSYFSGKANVKQVVVHAIVMCFVFVVYTLIENSLVSATSVKRTFAFFENPLFYEPGFFNRLPTVFYTIGYYFKILVFPFPLACYYGYDTLPVSGWTSLFVIISAVFYLSTGIYALLKFKERDIFSFGMFVFLIGLLPFSNLVEPAAGIVAERFVYFASLGFCIVAVYFLLNVFKIDLGNKNTGIKELKGLCQNSFTGIFIVFSILTISRNTKWKDEITLLRNDTKFFESSGNLHALLATKLYDKILVTPKGLKKEELAREATFHFKEEIRLLKEGAMKYPNDNITLNMIGVIYDNVFNDPVAAQYYYKKVIDHNAANDLIRYNWASCYMKRNLPDSAIASFRKIINSDSKELPVRQRLHDLYLQKKDYPEAIQNDLDDLNKHPQDAGKYVNLANSYILSGDTATALKYFEEGAKRDSHNAAFLMEVAKVFKLCGNKSKESEYLQKARAVSPPKI